MRTLRMSPLAGSLLLALPEVVVVWLLLSGKPDVFDFFLAGTLSILAMAGVVVTMWASEATRFRTAESQRISKRSQDADELLEQALAELRRVDAEARRQDEALVLARLWASVNSRLEKYHDDAQAQGRQAFGAAMTSMWIGFLVLVASGTAAVTASTTTGAIVVGSLGGVSAAVAGYIAKTFLRAHEETSRHLRGYFLQPVEMSRYLSAERVIAQSSLPAEAQTELMRVLVHSMVTGALAEDSGPAAARP